MDENHGRPPKQTTLLDFPSNAGRITITEDFGKWNELEAPNYTFKIELKARPSLEVASIPAQALAQVAFRLLKELKDHVPDHVLERMFEQEIGPL